MTGFVRNFIGGLESFFFPSLCRSCGAGLGAPGPRLLCEDCRAQIVAPLPADWRKSCRLGDGEVPCFARLPYDGPAGVAVRLLKFNGKRRMARLLAEGAVSLAGVLRREYNWGVVVPVPLHRVRRRERQFNQAEEIARGVAAAAGLEIRRRGLARTRNTRPQVELSAEERLANVKGAFEAREDFAGAKVLVLDDVITTGATVRECAGALREAGAGAVGALAVAGANLKETM